MENIYENNLLNKYKSIQSIKVCNQFLIDDEIVDNRDEFDSIYFSQDDFYQNKNKVYLVINENKNRYVIAYPKTHQNVVKNHLRINKLVCKNLVGDCKSLTIYELNNQNILTFSKIKKQLFNELKDEIITVSSKYEYIKNIDSEFYILINKKSNCRVVIAKSHILFDSNIPEDSIRLNRKQRIALGTINNDNGTESPSDIELLFYPYPNICSKKLTKLSYIKNKVLQIFVGKVNIGLISKRTYQSDETFNIVRISSDVMKLLGVSDTDIVKISYCYTSCSCRVLPISDNDKIIEQNNEPGAEKIYEVENLICIPASIRDTLGIPTVKPNISVKVERDMEYIFKKNINKQILPIILILFSTEIFVNGRELIIKILIAIISLPITLYFNLSNERSICK